MELYTLPKLITKIKFQIISFPALSPNQSLNLTGQISRFYVKAIAGLEVMWPAG